MKKTLLFISVMIVSATMYCQVIDTVYVRNLSFKYEEWCTIQYYFNGTDSASKKFYKRMRSVLVAANPATMATLVTVDSVPGKIALQWYQGSKQWPDYIRDEIGDNIQTKISSYGPVATFITTAIDGSLHNYFINVIRKNGKETIEN